MKTKADPVRGPTSAAGLVRYFDISGGGLEVSPEMVVGFAVFIILAEIAIALAL